MIVLYLKISAPGALTATAFGQAAAGDARSVIGVAPNALTGQWGEGSRTKMVIFRQNPLNGAVR
jgi:hypothetical protein